MAPTCRHSDEEVKIRPVVSVVIPTLCRQARGPLLRRALDSALAQEGVRVQPILVANGPDVDPALEQAFRSDTDLRFVRSEHASLPEAYRTGAQLVDAPYWTVMDDDDVLLPGALRCRVDALNAHREWDAVVTNGFRREGGADHLHIEDFDPVRRSPLEALFAANWLLPGAWLADSHRVGVWLVDEMPRGAETTWIAAVLSTRCRTGFVAEPTVVWHTDTPDGLHNETGRVYELREALGRMLSLPMPRESRELFKRKLAEACHTAARVSLDQGAISEAWRWHLRALVQPGGLAYLPSTRHLIRALFR